jgi:hypothetical protein
MRKIKMMGLAAIAAASLTASAGVSAASAANWDPQNTNITATNVGNTVLDDNAGHHITCTTSSTTLNAIGSVAMAITTTNPVSFTNCSNDVIGGTTTVSTAGTWSFHANSTTNVTATAANGTSPVATITLGGGICTISVSGPVDIPNNSWTNSAHQLHINSTSPLKLTQSGGCFGVVGTTATLTATYQLPASVIIT